jgi:hypothetical protein
MIENIGNATWLFIQPSRDHHNSESFWTTFFALYILGSCKNGEDVSIPTFNYIEKSGSWEFKPDKPLKIPANLDRTRIVVEGKIKNQIFGDIQINLQNISPNIIIHSNESNIIIIETKTVGSKLDIYQK